MKKCLFYGDSNTYGVDIAGGHSGSRYPENVRFTGILQESLKDGWEFVIEIPKKYSQSRSIFLS